MHVPEKIVIHRVRGVSFLPTVKEEYAAIRDAMKMRGITTLRSPMKMLEYRVVPLMMSIAKIGEELSCAALTRGLGAPQKRTNICKIGFGPLDIFFFLLAIPCWSVSLFVRRKKSMIELRNINFRYAGGTDAGGLVNIDLIIPTASYPFVWAIWLRKNNPGPVGEWADSELL